MDSVRGAFSQVLEYIAPLQGRNTSLQEAIKPTQEGQVPPRKETMSSRNGSALSEEVSILPQDYVVLRDNAGEKEMEVEEETFDGYLGSTDLHPLLSADTEKCAQLYGENAVSYYVLGSGEILLSLRFPTDHFNSDIAKIWGVSEPLVLRLAMNPNKYLDAKCKPEIVAVYGSTGKTGRVEHQMQNILKRLFNEKWPEWSNMSVEESLSEQRLASDNRLTAMKLDETFALVMDEYLARMNCLPSNSDEKVDHGDSNVTITTSFVHSVLLRNLHNGWLSMMYEYCRHRLNTLNECCVVCDEPHGVPLSTPGACSRPLCAFSANMYS